MQVPGGTAAAGHSAGDPEILFHGRGGLGGCTGVRLLFSGALFGTPLPARLPQHAWHCLTGRLNARSLLLTFVLQQMKGAHYRGME